MRDICLNPRCNGVVEVVDRPIFGGTQIICRQCGQVIENIFDDEKMAFDDTNEWQDDEDD